jgi:hypothetical protein
MNNIAFSTALILPQRYQKVLGWQVKSLRQSRRLLVFGYLKA